MFLVPARPLTVSLRHRLLTPLGALAAAVIGVGLGAGCIGLESGEVIDLLDIHDRWSRSTETPASVGGEITTRQLILSSYDLEIEYLDASEQVQTTRYEMTTLFGGPGVDTEVSVRLDPARPDQPVIVSWAAEFSGARWRAALLLIASGILIAAGGLVIAYAMIQRWRAASLAAEASTEVHCPVVDATLRQQGRQKFLDVRFEIPEHPDLPRESRGRRHRASFRAKKRQPLYADDAGTLLVALVPRADPKLAVPISDDLHPFALTPAQRRAHEEALAAHRARAEGDGAR